MVELGGNLVAEFNIPEFLVILYESVTTLRDVCRIHDKAASQLMI